MTHDDEARLGGRLPLLDPATLQGDQRKLYERLRSTLVEWAHSNGFRGMTDDGKLIGPFNPYLHSTGETPGFLEWMQADSRHSALNKKVHEIVILTVGAIWKSPYELYAHSAVARQVGVPDSVIASLCRGETPEELTDEEGVAHRFARELTSRHRVGDELYREAESRLGQRALVDLTFLIGMYLLTCAQLNAFDIPAPD